MSDEQIEVSTSAEPDSNDIIARLTAAMESDSEQTEAPKDVDEEVVEETIAKMNPKNPRRSKTQPRNLKTKKKPFLNL